MTEATKSCNLTRDEVKTILSSYGSQLYGDNIDYPIERINYLNKRLKAFSEEAPKNDAPNTANAANEGWT